MIAPGNPYSLGWEVWSDNQIEFPHRSPAVVDQDPLLDWDQPFPLPAQDAA